MSTKVAFINLAYSRLRISGLTVQPRPEDVLLALNRLENMAAQWAALNIDTGYAFEDQPNLNTPHNVKREFWDAYESNLAGRLAPDFGKEPSPGLMRDMQTSFSHLSARTAQVRHVQYPSRHPVGSGNRPLAAFFGQPVVEPISPNTKKLIIGDTNDYVEHFDSYLAFGETVVSFTIEASTGLVIVSSQLVGADVQYRITSSGDTLTEVQRVKIVATTSTARVETRLVYFDLTEVA